MVKTKQAGEEAGQHMTKNYGVCWHASAVVM